MRRTEFGMEKLWTGVFHKSLDEKANDFNSSITVDGRMYRQDINGSIAHVSMLASVGIISSDEKEKITNCLSDILSEIDSGKLEINNSAEDIHTFIENELTKRIGDVGKKLHTARSRNDQVATDLRLWIRDESHILTDRIKALIYETAKKASENKTLILPGYTHLQRAQPILFAHQLLAYCYMLLRDISRIEDAVKRMNLSPLGSCALAGTTYDTDRYFTASALGFDGITENSIDGVSDRDFCIEIISALSIIMMHLSRFSEEIVLWSTAEFHFIEIDDSFTTGSSIMPQKKNPDIAELVRGKVGRVYGDLIAMLTVMKGLPLAYNKDLQEDKEAVFDAFDTVVACLDVFAPMIASIRPISGNMLDACKEGFINATDLADYLVGKGIPFRDAYRISGQAIALCIATGNTLDSLSIRLYRSLSPVIDEEVYTAIALENCVARRISAGGTGYTSVNQQLKQIFDFCKPVQS